MHTLPLPRRFKYNLIVVAHFVTMLTHPTFNTVMICILSLICVLCAIPWAPSVLAGIMMFDAPKQPQVIVSDPPASVLADIMMFDAPGSSRRFIPWAVFLLTLSWWFPLVFGPIMGFFWLYQGHVALANMAVIIPITPFVVLAAFLTRNRMRR